MFINTIRKSLLITAATLALASAAVAGGNTIAASEKPQNLAASTSITLASGLSVFNDFGTDICATIVNRSEKVGLIQLTLTDYQDATSSSTISKGKSSGLCVKEGESVEATCVGPATCKFTWTVDKF